MTRRWAVLGLVLAARLAAHEFYVAPDGHDGAEGTAGAPFATPGRAAAAVRAAEKESAGPATVWLRGGYYDLAASWVLGPADSGRPGQPVTYASVPGEFAFLTGARRIDPGWFDPVGPGSPLWTRLDPAARGKTYVADLFRHGWKDFGRRRIAGFGLRVPAPMELFCAGRPMTVARWPNEGEPLARMGRVTGEESFAYLGSRPDRWSAAGPVWLHGWWAQPWADYHLPLRAVDRRGKRLILAAPPPQYGLSDTGSFYAYNLIEEIDRPGEYCLDDAAGTLTWWPPPGWRGCVLQISVLETELLRVEGAHDVSFQRLAFEAGRGPLARVRASSRVRFEQCLFRNAGEEAVSLDGADNGLAGCAIGGCGAEGVRLAGGDRATLRDGGNFVQDCRIVQTGRIAWAYKPGIAFEGGCGNRVVHNLIGQMPHAAILLGGNNHLIAGNEIWHVCQSTSDAGAIYGGRSWSERGNAIRGNFLHDLGDNGAVHGVYLDDCLSGEEVRGNVFCRISGTAIFCGGGRDNVVENNVIAWCGAAHHNDDRGLDRIDSIPGDSWNLLESLAQDGIAYRNEPWASAYPACAALPPRWDEVKRGRWRSPENNVFRRNAGWANAAWMDDSGASRPGVFLLYRAVRPNWPSLPPLLTPEQCRERALRPLSLAVEKKGFVAIAFRSIGPTLPWGGRAAGIPPPPEAFLHRTRQGREMIWRESVDLPSRTAEGFVVESRPGPDRGWDRVASCGPEADALPVPPAAWYRIGAYNAAGVSFSEAVAGP